MTEKRFTKYVPDSYGYTYITTIIDNEKNKQTGNTDEIVDMLNELAEEKEQLKSKNRGLQSELQIFKEDVTHSNLQNNKLTDENEELKKEKERYKRLSEIRQQQINNRILTIKEFINNCSDNKVRSVLKDLFYSEVKEYDLSAQNRKLLHENEQLKNELEKLSYANEDLLEEKRIWKQMSDEYTKLSYENEQLNLLSNLRGEMVSFATSLIQDMGSEEMLKMWNDFKEVMYQKWKKGD